MDPRAYVEMSETEDHHWWFTGRRTILRSVIANMALPNKARILEVGAGTGGNLSMLAQFGAVQATEMDENARALALQKTRGQFDIRYGRCPADLPFADDRFDLICMFDVLEHVDDDTQTLAALKRLLAPNGRMLITVPAFQWLWSAHDTYLHHKRRYRRSQLADTASAAGLRIERLSYFNTMLFPLAVAARLQDRALRRSQATGTAIPMRFVNTALNRIFGTEHRILRWIDLPFGVSLMAIIRA